MDKDQITIDGVTYKIASWDTVELGEDLEEKFPHGGFRGMGEAFRATDAGYLMTDNVDMTTIGRMRLAPEVTYNTAITEATRPKSGCFFEATDGVTDFIYMTLGHNAQKMKSDGTQEYQDDLSGDGTSFGVAAYFESEWFAPEGSGDNFVKLTPKATGVGTAWDGDEAVDAGTLKALHFTTFQDGATAKLARGQATPVVDFADTNPETAAEWGEDYETGDSGQTIRAMVEGPDGLLYVSTDVNLYRGDGEGNFYGLNPFVNKGKPSTTNGLGTWVSAPYIFWPHESGLQVFDVRSDDWNRVSLDDIPWFREVGNITAPVGYRARHGVSIGDWNYWICNGGDDSGPGRIIGGYPRKRIGGAGISWVWHSIYYSSTAELALLYVDSAKKLWWVEMNGTSNVTAFMQLNADGSPRSISANRGAASKTYTWYGPDLDFGKPDKLKQFRAWDVQHNMASGGSAYIQYQNKVYIDEGSATSVDSAVSGSDAWAQTTSEWTVGTNDTGYRLRPSRVFTTGGSYVNTGDPMTGYEVIRARTPTIEQAILKEGPQTLREMKKVVRKLQNAGTKTIIEPETGDSFSGEVVSVRNVTLRDQTKALEVKIRRWDIAS
jgi:hypothetical protein